MFPSLLKLKYFLFSKNFIHQARERHSYFRRFPHGWAVEEFLKANLKNKRAYARKRGYLGDQTNIGVESDKEDKEASASDQDSDQDSDHDGADRDDFAGGSLGGDDNIDVDQEGDHSIDENDQVDDSIDVNDDQGSWKGARASDDDVDESEDLYTQ